MKRALVVGAIAFSFVLGAVVGAVAAKKQIDPGVFRGAEPQAAAQGLLDIGAELAADGSWENINIGRVHYLGGQKEKGQAIFDRVLAQSGEPGDLIRIGRVYVAADEWDKAMEMFDRVLAKASKDEDWAAEIGAYYNLMGNREKAEDLFAFSFAEAPRDLRNLLAAAGSYLGVKPQGRL